MYRVYISEIAFAQSAKYVIIAKTPHETKRSQICNLWTSAPTFPEPIALQSVENLTVKACSATIDRKLTVIGGFGVGSGDLQEGQECLYDQQRYFGQLVEGKEVCVGSCRLRIVRDGGDEEEGQLAEVGDDYQLRSQSSQEQPEDGQQQQPKCQLKFIMHGGFDFFMNSGFKMCIRWGGQKCQTKCISNRIAPFWGSTHNLRGRQDKLVQISVLDSKNNKLQWLKLDPKQIRIMYPYHLHVKFREQYVGMCPHFYLTIIREDVPLYSILDKKINMKIRYVGPAAPQRTQQYLLIYPKDLQANEVNRLPIFVDLDMKNYISFETINQLIENSPDRRYEWTNWNLLIPVNVSTQEIAKQSVSLLKSFLTKSLVCLYFTLEEPKQLFCHQVWNSVGVVDRKQNFENAVKELYYQERRIVMGKAVQLSNLDAAGLEKEKGAVSLEDRWKILTHNYGLRKQMLTKSIETTEDIKKQIESKGQYLQHLKKVLVEVKKMNDIMVHKQKSSLMENTKVGKKIRENFAQYSTVQIVTSLLEKQVQLQKRKKINDQMRMRMDSLNYFNEDSEQLDRIIVENAQRLLEQQAKIKQLNKMREVLPKQRDVILKMEKMFQKRQIDKQMNQLLQKQQDKLSQMKKQKTRNLEKVYTIVKDHKNSPHSLLESIKAAEAELIHLNAQYAKMATT